MKVLSALGLLPLGLICAVSPAIAAPKVVATIKPIHALVAAVMGDIGSPLLIVKGGASPHTYALKPSDASALEAAAIVFWAGHGMELFLQDSLDTLAANAVRVALDETPGLVTFPNREGGAFEAHEDEAEAGHEQAGQGHNAEAGHVDEQGAVDMHFWLDPVNAEAMVHVIAATLAVADPDNAAAYAANAGKEIAELAALTAELDAALARVRDKPFIVFHDAYQYFEKRFGLTIAGSLTISPEVAPGAQRLDELKTRVVELGATCVFAEPQFEPAIIVSITEGTPAKTGVLDPEASLLTEGPDLYPALLRGIAASLIDCLGR